MFEIWDRASEEGMERLDILCCTLLAYPHIHGGKEVGVHTSFILYSLERKFKSIQILHNQLLKPVIDFSPQDSVKELTLTSFDSGVSRVSYS